MVQYLCNICNICWKLEYYIELKTISVLDPKIITHIIRTNESLFLFPTQFVSRRFLVSSTILSSAGYVIHTCCILSTRVAVSARSHVLYFSFSLSLPVLLACPILMCAAPSAHHTTVCVREREYILST